MLCLLVLGAMFQVRVRVEVGYGVGLGSGLWNLHQHHRCAALSQHRYWLLELCFGSLPDSNMSNEFRPGAESSEREHATRLSCKLPPEPSTTLRRVQPGL